MKSPLVPPQAVEKGTGIARKRDADAAALLCRGCETALCCDAAALKSLKEPTVLPCKVCVSLMAMGMMEERHAQSCQPSFPNQVFGDVLHLLGSVRGSRGGRRQQSAVAGLLIESGKASICKCLNNRWQMLSHTNLSSAQWKMLSWLLSSVLCFLAMKVFL